MMRSCDVRGGGPGVSAAYMAGGVFVEGDYSVGEFYNVSFTDLHGMESSAALYVQGSTTEESGIFVRLAGCQFLR